MTLGFELINDEKSIGLWNTMIHIFVTTLFYLKYLQIPNFLVWNSTKYSNFLSYFAGLLRFPMLRLFYFLVLHFFIIALGKIPIF